MAKFTKYGSLVIDYGHAQDTVEVEAHKEASARRINKDELKHLVLRRVTLTSCPLGQGSYATVYKAEYNGTSCAAKQVDLSVTHFPERIKQNFLLECLQHSKLSHPNIVKMLGVFYPKKETLPVLVMELMEYNLTQLLKRSHSIPMYVKLSILQDVSRGICYLHAQNPPIVHQALYSDNILFAKGLTAKIADFKTGAETVSDQALLSTRQNKDCSDFLPYSCDVLKYELPLNVFSFGCIICHVITQKWPSLQGLLWPINIPLTTLDDDLSGSISSTSTVDYSYQDYSQLIVDSSLKRLVEMCLQRDPKDRPHISQVYERITSVMTDHCDDDNLKKAYSLAMMQGLDQSMNFQLLVVGEKNTGKSSLVSSFLGEKFDERQSTTKGIDIKVCKIHHKDWIRINHSDKDSLLHNHLADHCMNHVMANPSVVSSPKPFSSNPSFNVSNHMHSDMSFARVPLVTSPSSDTDEDSCQPHPLYMQQEFSLKAALYNLNSPIASLWDFAGDVTFHNVFISSEGVFVITFNASMELTGDIIPREGLPQPPECCIAFPNIHYWLQVVNSVCSVKENVLLVGTHIDKLHPDLKKARKIASSKILPVLEKELHGKPYAHHIVAYSSKGLKLALKKSCFFVSNKCQDEQIGHLKAATMKVAISLRKEKPVIFIKIEQALLQLNKQVISVFTMLALVAKNAISLSKNSAEFKGILKYFQTNHTILHFGETDSLKDLVILSPHWLDRFFSYVIAGHSYENGGELDWAWKWLTEHGILHESLFQHMLDKFHSDYPVAGSIQITQQQAVDILLCFHLVAFITREAWFAEDSFPSLPDESGDIFIVPSLVHVDDDRNPPESEQERIIYFKFNSGFIPTSLLSQLIAECICRSVRRNDQLLWMRHGKMGSQLGADQKYYISQCKEKQSIQLTITVVGDDKEHMEERRTLIHDVSKLLDDIMKVFMPAIKERPSLLIPCPFCPKLHILLVDACSGKAISCPNDDDESLPCGYYSDLLQGELVDATAITGVDRKLEIFTAYYSRLSLLDFRTLYPHLITAEVISHEDCQIVKRTDESAKVALCILDKISTSLRVRTDDKFDKFLSILEVHNDFACTSLAKEIRTDLLKSPTAIASPTVEKPSHEDTKKSPHKEITEATAFEMNSPLLPNAVTTGNYRWSSTQGVCCKCCSLM